MRWAWGGCGSGRRALVAAVLVGVVVIAFLAGRAAARPPGTSAQPTREEQPTPEELLAQRFARGEIDEQQYRSGRDALAGTRADPTGR